MSYASLHCHTEGSNIRMLDSTTKVGSLIDTAMEKKLTGVAITDHETVGMHVKALNYFKEKKEKKIKEIEALIVENIENRQYSDFLQEELKYYQNFKLILGNEIYLTRDNLNKENYVKGEDEFYHFILLAKDAIGHEQLRELSSRAWSHSFRQYIERVPTYYSDLKEVIGKNPGHIIASTACLGSEFARLMMKYVYEGKDKSVLTKMDNFVASCKKLFGDDFYIELQASDSEDQEKYNKAAARYANFHDIPIIVTTDVHYLNKEDRTVHKAYLNSNEGDREVDAFYSGTYMMTSEEIKEKLIVGFTEDETQVFLNNTNLIRDKVEEYNLDFKQIVPKVVLLDKPSIDEKIKALIVEKVYINNFINSENEQDNYYIHKILDGLKNIIEEDKWEQYINRIEQELEEVWEISLKINDNLSAYFNTMAKVIDIIWTDAESIVGVSRGSAGGFVTNYLLGITQMDPLIYEIELPHWRLTEKL